MHRKSKSPDKPRYVLNKEAIYVADDYDNMLLFIVEVLPLSAAEVSTFGFRRFFTTMKIAQREAKRREAVMEESKNKSKTKRGRK